MTLEAEKKQVNGNLGVTVSGDGYTRIASIENFTKRLNEKPTNAEEYNGAAYIPASMIETSLDEDYAGLWQIENFRWQVIANEIVGSLDLLVFHPVAKVWLKRSGSGSVMIRQNKGANLTDIDQKIKNGLVMDFPKLQIACLKAAAKSLGKKYGRDLNRKFEDEYDTIYSDEAALDEVKMDLEAKLNGAKDRTALGEIWKTYPQFHKNSQLLKLFNSKNALLNAQRS